MLTHNCILLHRARNYIEAIDFIIHNYLSKSIGETFFTYSTPKIPIHYKSRDSG